MCSCSLSKANYPKSLNLYLQIENFDYINYSDQSMILKKLLKIETIIFMQHKTINK